MEHTIKLPKKLNIGKLGVNFVPAPVSSSVTCSPLQ